MYPSVSTSGSWSLQKVLGPTPICSICSITLEWWKILQVNVIRTWEGVRSWNDPGPAMTCRAILGSKRQRVRGNVGKDADSRCDERWKGCRKWGQIHGFDSSNPRLNSILKMLYKDVTRSSLTLSMRRAESIK